MTDDLKAKIYESIEKDLIHIAVLRRLLIVKGEDAEKVTEFIVKIDTRELQRLQYADEFDLMFEMMGEIAKGREAKKK